jgi:hypothetical protein
MGTAGAGVQAAIKPASAVVVPARRKSRRVRAFLSPILKSSDLGLV